MRNPFQRRKAEPSEAPVWAFEASATRSEPEAEAAEEREAFFAPNALASHASDDAWRILLFQHMPYHLPEPEQHAKLLEERKRLEQMPIGSYERYGYDPPAFLAERRVIHIARARLMEQAFSTLRLDRYANAPANRGWMNLFREWSGVTGFDEEIQASERRYSKAFVYFYASYIRNRTSIDLDPIPHPWDAYTGVDAALIADVERTKDAMLILDDFEREFAESEREMQPSTEEDFWQARERTPNVFLDSGSIDPRGNNALMNAPPLSKDAPAKEREMTDTDKEKETPETA